MMKIDLKIWRNYLQVLEEQMTAKYHQDQIIFDEFIGENLYISSFLKWFGLD